MQQTKDYISDAVKALLQVQLSLYAPNAFQCCKTHAKLILFLISFPSKVMAYVVIYILLCKAVIKKVSTSNTHTFFMNNLKQNISY